MLSICLTFCAFVAQTSRTFPIYHVLHLQMIIFLIYATPLQYFFHPSTQAASLGYDEHEHTWNRDAFERNKESAAEYTALHPFIPATSTANNGVSAGISSGAISVTKANSSAKLVSSEPAGKITLSLVLILCKVILVGTSLHHSTIVPSNFLLFIYVFVHLIPHSQLSLPPAERLVWTPTKQPPPSRP